MKSLGHQFRTFVGRSAFVRRAHAVSLRKYAHLYRRIRSTDRTDAYQRLVDPDRQLRDDEISDEGLFTETARLKPHPEAANPVLTRHDITDAPATFVADPFVVYNRGVYDMFFEIKDSGGEVYIGHAFSEDGLDYEYNQTILAPEVAQHTYPHVFRYDGEWVMVPSPGANVNGEFRVYVAEEYPTEWRLVATPIPDRVRQDPTPILWDGTWYLIYQDTDSMDIVLAYADSLTDSGWQTHPASPIFRNDTDAIEQCSIGGAEMVPSGRPVYHDDSVDIFYRSHINTELYQYRITELSPERFEQHRVAETPVFGGTNRQQWNERFMHTLNPVYPWRDAADIIAVDGLEADNYRYSIGIYTTDTSDGSPNSVQRNQ